MRPAFAFAHQLSWAISEFRSVRATGRSAGAAGCAPPLNACQAAARGRSPSPAELESFLALPDPPRRPNHYPLRAETYESFTPTDVRGARTADCLCAAARREPSPAPASGSATTPSPTRRGSRLPAGDRGRDVHARLSDWPRDRVRAAPRTRRAARPRTRVRDRAARRARSSSARQRRTPAIAALGWQPDRSPRRLRAT